MQVTALDGREIRIRRRWLPWRPRNRKFWNLNLDWFNLTSAADDVASFVVALVVSAVLFIAGGLVLGLLFLPFELALVVMLLGPLLALARILWVMPWIIEVRDPSTVLGVAKVRGWRDSEETIRDLAASYRRGEDPFAASKPI